MLSVHILSLLAMRTHHMPNANMAVLHACSYVCHNNTNTTNNSNITVQGFFSLYPQLHPYLLTQLQRASEPVHKSSFTLAPRLHPLLHPTLLLLSRLRPALVTAAATATGSSDGDSEESSSVKQQQQLTAAPFIPLVMQTRGSG
jgi:hypothetical protein